MFNSRNKKQQNIYIYILNKYFPSRLSVRSVGLFSLVCYLLRHGPVGLQQRVNLALLTQLLSMNPAVRKLTGDNRKPTQIRLKRRQHSQTQRVHPIFFAVSSSQDVEGKSLSCFASSRGPATDRLPRPI